MTVAPLFSRLFRPLNFAAYLTWAAVFMSLLNDSRGQRQLALILMIGFIAAFVARSLIEQEDSNWRHHMLVALQGVFAIALCAVWNNNAAAPVLTIIVVAQFAMRLQPAALIGAVAVLDIGLFYVFAVVQQLGQPWMALFIYGGFQAFTALTAWYARNARESAEAFQRTNAHLLATRSLLEESARDQERLRLSRELHDVAGHKLTALKLNLALLKRSGNPETTKAVEVSDQLASELLDDLRAVVAQLRKHDGIDLRNALAQLVAPLPRPRVHLELDDSARVDDVAQADALIRAAQEALTNIARHSHAENAWISLRREGNAVHLHVHDDGRGGPQLKEGNGLTGMRERLAALGGSLQLSQAAAGGLALDVTLPLR